MPGLGLSPFLGTEEHGRQVRPRALDAGGGEPRHRRRLEYNRDLFDRATVARLAGPPRARSSRERWRRRTGRSPSCPCSPARSGGRSAEWQRHRHGFLRRPAAPTSCSRRWAERAPEAVAVVFAGPAADLPRAERAGEPAGPPPAGARRRRGGPGRLLPRPLARPADRRAGGAQVRRRLRAARSRAPAGAAGLRAERHPRRGGAHGFQGGGPAGGVAAGRGQAPLPRPGRAGGRRGPGGESAPAAGDRRAAGLHHLHLGLDGPAQGGAGAAPGAGQLPGVDGPAAGADPGGHLARHHHPVVRHGGARGAAPPDHRGAHRHRARRGGGGRRGAGAPARLLGSDRAPGDAHAPGGC